MTDEIPREDEMLSANQAGKLLGITGKTAIRMMEAGELTGYRIGTAYKFRRGDIESFLESHRYQPGQPKRKRKKQEE